MKKEDGYSLFRDRATINATCRFVYNTHPIVNSIINSHTDLPLNHLHIDFPDNTKAKSIFEDQVNSINLVSKIQSIIQEYWLIGEAFIYAELDEKKGIWSSLTIQNPDYVIIKRSVIQSECKYFLRPDENLRRIVFSDKEPDKQAVKSLNNVVVHCIKQGENIPLDNFYLSHIVRKMSPYEIRGTGLLFPLLTTITSNIENQDTSAEMIRNCLIDPFINNNVNMGRIKSNYRTLFTTIERWVNEKLFMPITKINDLYELKDGDKIPLVPKVSFDLEALIKDLKE